MNRSESKQRYQSIMIEAQERDEWPGVMRELALNDLFFLILHVLGRKDIDRDWLYNRCREVETCPDGYIDLWFREGYKDLANDTPMLTANRGWVAHGDLVVGDIVFAPNGKQVKVLATTAVFIDSECYRITFDNGASIVAGAGHEWTLRRKIKHRIAPMQEKRWNEYVDEVFSTIELSKFKGRKDVGCSAPLKYEKEELPIPPYLLGCWLGDGNSDGPRITCDYKDTQIIDEIRKEGTEVKEVSSSNENSGLFAFGNGIRGEKGTGLWPTFRELGLAGKKHIPKIYMESSVDQRWELLCGLMDTDGSCSVKGKATFCQKEEGLAQQVCDLAIGLGLRPRINKYGFLYKGLQYHYYQVNFQSHTDRAPFKLTRKIKRAIPPSYYREVRSIKSIIKIPSVPTRCIQVEGGRYVAGRDLVPTNNSTIITYGLTIQDILKDPELTVGIFSATRPIAKAFLRQIKREFEDNARLKALFPEICYQNPRKESPKWSEDDGIIVKRKGNPKESTVEAWGLVDGQPTGRHFQLMVYDDVVTRESVTTPEMIIKINGAWELSRNLTTVGGRTRHIGTRYHYNDTYHLIMERGAAIPRIYPATDNGTTAGKSIFFSEELLAEKRREMGSFTFATQMLQDPKADSIQGFYEDDLRFWPATQYAHLNIYLLFDPANEKKKRSDYTAAFVVGVGEDNNYYVIDIIRDRLSLTERGNLIFKLHRDYRPLGVGYEKYGKDADIEHFEDRMERENYRFVITPLGGQMSKPDRINTLMPLFEDHRIYLPDRSIHVNYEGIQEDTVKVFVNEEFKAFPFSAHDDLLDCLARINDPDFNMASPQRRTFPNRQTVADSDYAILGG